MTNISFKIKEASHKYFYLQLASLIYILEFSIKFIQNTLP